MGSTRNWFAPRAGRYGIIPAFFRAAVTATIANSTTTTANVGGPHRRANLERLSASMRTVVTSAGAVTGIVSKYDASADAAVALTAAFDLKALVAEESSIIPLLTSLTDAQLLFDEGDTLRLVVTAAGTITQQPVDFVLNAEFAVKE